MQPESYHTHGAVGVGSLHSPAGVMRVKVSLLALQAEQPPLAATCERLQQELRQLQAGCTASAAATAAAQQAKDALMDKLLAEQHRVRPVHYASTLTPNGPRTCRRKLDRRNCHTAVVSGQPVRGVRHERPLTCALLTLQSLLEKELVKGAREAALLLQAELAALQAKAAAHAEVRTPVVKHNTLLHAHNSG